jgi:hypothetical protein
MSVLTSGSKRFTAHDLYELSDLVAAAWTSAADRDWSVPAGTVEWSCTRTANHAVDCVYAPAFFLASRRLDRYPETGLTMSPDPTPALLVESLGLATRFLVAVVNDAPSDARSIIFRRPDAVIGAPADFLPRGAMELILHAHDVCAGLGVPFEPATGLCHRLCEHTRPWGMWEGWGGLAQTDDPWGDLLSSSGRARA